MTGSSAPTLSVIVITRDEAQRLPACLGSVHFADEIVVVDSASRDGTPEIARSLGARVIATSDWPGYGPQKQRALEAARGEWVLSLDADEWLDETLAAAVRDVVARPHASSLATSPVAYRLDRLSAFCGQWMRAGSWQPDPVLRLFRRERARFSADRVHERLIVDGPVGDLPGRLLHDSLPTFELALDKMNRYTSTSAIEQHAAGRRSSLAKAVGHGAWAFVRSYLLRQGFRDGRLGFVLAALDAQSSYTRYVKLWLADRAAGGSALPMPSDPSAPERSRGQP